MSNSIKDTYYLVTYRDPKDGQIISLKVKKVTDSSLGLSFIALSDFMFESDMLVVNPAVMQVTARLNQVDVSKVHVGQAAEVRLDAYPDLVFPGKVERISAISTASQYSKRIRYFAAIVSIQGSNPKLLPDLTAAVDIRLQTLDSVLLLPREAVIVQQGQTMVEVLVDGRPELRPIKIGPRNDCEVVIESGLQEGMTVSLNPQVAVGAGKRLPE